MNNKIIYVCECGHEHFDRYPIRSHYVKNGECKGKSTPIIYVNLNELKKEKEKSLSFHKDQMQQNMNMGFINVAHHHEIIVDFIENELSERLGLCNSQEQSQKREDKIENVATDTSLSVSCEQTGEGKSFGKRASTLGGGDEKYKGSSPVQNPLSKDSEEYKWNLELNRLCSLCYRYADVVIPDKVKLCNSCYKIYNEPDKRKICTCPEGKLLKSALDDEVEKNDKCPCCGGELN